MPDQIGAAIGASLRDPLGMPSANAAVPASDVQANSAVATACFNICYPLRCWKMPCGQIECTALVTNAARSWKLGPRCTTTTRGRRAKQIRQTSLTVRYQEAF